MNHKSAAREPIFHPVITVTHNFSGFQGVVIHGLVNVRWTTGSHYSVRVTGDTETLQHTSAVIRSGALHLQIQSQKRPITLTMVTPRLSYFTYRGAGDIKANLRQSAPLNMDLRNAMETQITGSVNLAVLKIKNSGSVKITGIHSAHMLLTIKESPSVQLEGVVNVNDLNLDGIGRLNIYWLSTNSIKVRARGSMVVQLAGIAKRLDVELWDTAHFNGRFLRGYETFIKTHDKSQADIVTVRYQHTLARDTSNIYFYKLPEGVADFMDENGSVLDFRNNY